jgi:hypothetical protein
MSSSPGERSCVAELRRLTKSQLWDVWYRPVPVVAHTMKGGAIPEGPWRACVYWRTLNRFRGERVLPNIVVEGRPNVHTLLFRFAPRSVEAVKFSNLNKRLSVEVTCLLHSARF